MSKYIVIATAIVSLVLINLQIINKESVLSEGEQVFIDLAPVDPRSLMQGDYMILRYKLPPDITSKRKHLPRKGLLVGELDANRILKVKTIYKAGDKLASNQRLIQYRIRDRGVRIGSGAYFFQEGHAKLYNHAKYGELRLAKSGKSVLTGLRDKELTLLGPEKDRAHSTSK